METIYWKRAGIFISKRQFRFSAICCWKTILDSLITFFLKLLLHPWNSWTCFVPLQKLHFPKLSHHSKYRKQEVLVAMAQLECYVLTNTAQWHLAKSAVAVWSSSRMCRHACVCPRSCKFSCPVNVPLPASICLLADRRMICTGGSWEISFRDLIKHSRVSNRSSNSDFCQRLYITKYYFSW